LKTKSESFGSLARREADAEISLLSLPCFLVSVESNGDHAVSFLSDYKC
jgi:hypothetical protein